MVEDIKRLVEKEKEAERLVEDAKKKAEQILRDAERQARLIVEAAERTSFDDVLKQGEERIERKKAELLREYGLKADRLREEGEKRLRDAVGHIFKAVLGLEVG